MESSQVTEKSWRTLRIRKMQPKFDKKKFEILSLFPGFDGMVKKTSHATVPLSKVPVRNFTQCKSTCYFETSWVCCVGAPAFREKCELFMPGTKHTTFTFIYFQNSSQTGTYLKNKFFGFLFQTLVFSALHLRKCMKWSRFVLAGFVE
jgi:hypothetical protein